MSANKTAIVTGAQLEIGGGLTEGFLQAGHNIVGTSPTAAASLSACSRLVLVDGDVSKHELRRTVEAGVKHFGMVNLREVLHVNGGAPCGSLVAMNDLQEASHVAGFEFRR